MMSLSLYTHILCSHSDSDLVQAKPVAAAVDLLPSLESDAAVKIPTVITSDDSLISHLVKLVSDQHQMISELKSQQERNYLALHDQMLHIKTSISEDQKAVLTEMKMDQRILYHYLFTLTVKLVMLADYFLRVKHVHYMY